MSLFERTVSGFPLSISTGLAFESLFPIRQPVYDEERLPPVHIDIQQYNQMWINVDTLFRNLLDSADKTILMSTNYKEVVTVLIDEMNTIESLLMVEGQGVASPVFYVCDYEHALRNIHRAFSLRKPTSGNQLWRKSLRDEVMKELKKLKTQIVFFPGSIKTTEKPNALMLSHIPYDLTSKRYFQRLDLLESNTGKLKKPADWNTKYYPVPGYDMRILPFYRFLLLSLGDKVLIQPFPIKIRKQIMECATNRGWTPMTTTDKVLLDLSMDLHTFDYSVIQSAKTAFGG